VTGIGSPVIYENYHYRGKEKPRSVTLAYGLIIGETSNKFKIRNIKNGREVWRIKENIRT
jgi:hypothetical protein